jgi:hypothetical protein
MRRRLESGTVFAEALVGTPGPARSTTLTGVVRVFRDADLRTPIDLTADATWGRLANPDAVFRAAEVASQARPRGRKTFSNIGIREVARERLNDTAPALSLDRTVGEARNRTNSGWMRTLTPRLQALFDAAWNSPVATPSSSSSLSPSSASSSFEF